MAVPSSEPLGSRSASSLPVGTPYGASVRQRAATNARGSSKVRSHSPAACLPSTSTSNSCRRYAPKKEQDPDTLPIFFLFDTAQSPRSRLYAETSPNIRGTAHKSFPSDSLSRLFIVSPPCDVIRWGVCSESSAPSARLKIESFFIFCPSLLKKAVLKGNAGPSPLFASAHVSVGPSPSAFYLFTAALPRLNSVPITPPPSPPLCF